VVVVVVGGAVVVTTVVVVVALEVVVVVSGSVGTSVESVVLDEHAADTRPNAMAARNTLLMVPSLAD
jgi:hypothetical protein